MDETEQHFAYERMKLCLILSQTTNRMSKRERNVKAVSKGSNKGECFQDIGRCIHGDISGTVKQLRKVPTKYKAFCAGLGPCGKSRSLQGLLESTKKNRGSHAFFRALNLNKNADISIFLKKEGKDISFQISLEFAFTHRKANAFKKIFKLHGKW